MRTRRSRASAPTLYQTWCPIFVNKDHALGSRLKSSWEAGIGIHIGLPRTRAPQVCAVGNLHPREWSSRRIVAAKVRVIEVRTGKVGLLESLRGDRRRFRSCASEKTHRCIGPVETRALEVGADELGTEAAVPAMSAPASGAADSSALEGQSRSGLIRKDPWRRAIGRLDRHHSISGPAGRPPPVPPSRSSRTLPLLVVIRIQRTSSLRRQVPAWLYTFGNPSLISAGRQMSVRLPGSLDQRERLGSRFLVKTPFSLRSLAPHQAASD